MAITDLSRILTESLPFPLDWLPTPAYWVGGSVRDGILEKNNNARRRGGQKLDLDLVLVNHSVEWASEVARRLQGGFVVLDRERQIARIVLPQTTIDVALQMGSSITQDLALRDFTCNAIAWEIHSHQCLDPQRGIEAIQQRVIRMIHPDNLSSDPLRLLRAYRQAAQLKFTLDPLTEVAIRERGSLLKQVAAERVRTELQYLLGLGSIGLPWLAKAWQDRILEDWLPQVRAQGFVRAEAVISWQEKLSPNYPNSFSNLKQILADQRTMEMTVLWAALLDPDPSVSSVLDALRLSRLEQQTIQKLHTLLPKFESLLLSQVSATDYYLFFQESGFLFPEVILLALSQGVALETVIPWLDHYEDPQDPLAHQIPLLDGKSVLQVLGLKPGPQVGALLSALALAQARAEVKTLEEAILYGQHWIQKH
jgi:tRNA nucleotidyltransferase (CCA-adding enzyme)